MALLYKRRWQLKGVHTNAILALAYSKSGQYLASAGMDSRLCLWSSFDQEPKFTIQGAAGFISIAWVDDCTLLAGMEDGNMIAVKFTETLLCVTGFEMHNPPLECLDVKDAQLATGAHSDVCIWDLVPSADAFERCVLLRNLGAPPTSGLNQHKPVIAITVAWAPSLAAGALLVSYMDHGVMVWDTISGNVMKALPMVASSGFSCLSPDQHWLAISNFSTGFDIYDTTLMTPSQKIIHRGILKHSPSDTLSCLPVLFVHQGMALAGLTPSGTVGVWDWKMEELLHTLPHEGNPPISSLAAYCLPEQDQFFIVTGTSLLGETGADTHIQIWQAQPNGEQASRNSSIPRLIEPPHQNYFLTSRHWVLIFVAVLVGVTIPYAIPRMIQTVLSSLPSLSSFQPR